MVLDLSLPDVDGLNLLSRLRNDGVTLPVLILTARDGVEDRILGLDRGGDDYLAQPFALVSWRRACVRCHTAEATHRQAAGPVVLRQHPQ